MAISAPEVERGSKRRETISPRQRGFSGKWFGPLPGRFGDVRASYSSFVARYALSVLTFRMNVVQSMTRRVGSLSPW